MKNIIFAALMAMTSFTVSSQEHSQDCYCPTCPNHVRKCSNTGNNYKRAPTKYKLESRPSKSPASAKGAKAQNT